MKGNDIHRSRLLRCKEIGKTEVLALGLTGKGEAHALRALIVLIDNQIISLRLAGKVAINHPGHNQVFRSGTLFQLVVDWPDGLPDKPLVLFQRLSALLELPLPFKQGCLINKGEHFIKRNIFNDSRAIKRRLWNFDLRPHIGTCRMASVTFDLNDTAWSNGFPDA